MGQCIECGKSGIFFIVDNYGLCKRCSSSINGYIRYFDLIPFWLSLSKDEREKCIGAENKDNGIGTGELRTGIIKDSFYFTSQRKTQFLYGFADSLIRHKEYVLAEKFLVIAEKEADNVIDLHFCYNHWIELMYKQRDCVAYINNTTAYLNRCVLYCMKDIEMFPRLVMALKNEYGNDIPLPRIPAFERLAIINEKRGNYKEAIKLCEIALQYGLKDSTKGGFEGRLEKLKKIK